MSINVVAVNPKAQDVLFTDDVMSVQLADGRRISVPLAWYPRLLKATPTQREQWELLGDGEGIHWESIDEDLSVAGLLRGMKDPNSTA